MARPETHANGADHSLAWPPRGRLLQARVAVAVAALLSALGLLNVLLTNADMDRLEAESPARLAAAGGGFERFLPSILTNLPRPGAPFNAAPALGGAASADPRRAPAYVEDKRRLERWLALTGVGLAVLFPSLEVLGDRSPPPARRAAPGPARVGPERTSVGRDAARFLLLLSLAYAALSLFETG